MKFEVGQTAYIVENNHIVRKVTIVSRKGDFYTVLFENGKGGIWLKEHRIFPIKQQRKRVFPKKRKRLVIALRMIICFEGEITKQR